MGFSKQALYCYNKAYSLDPTNVDALWDRAILAREIGQMNTVRVTPLILFYLAYTINSRQGPHSVQS